VRHQNEKFTNTSSSLVGSSMINRFRYMEHNRKLSKNHVPSSRSIDPHDTNSAVYWRMCANPFENRSKRQTELPTDLNLTYSWDFWRKDCNNLAIFRNKVRHDAELLRPGSERIWNQRKILVLVGVCEFFFWLVLNMSIYGFSRVFTDFTSKIEEKRVPKLFFKLP